MTGGGGYNTIVRIGVCKLVGEVVYGEHGRHRGAGTDIFLRSYLLHRSLRIAVDLIGCLRASFLLARQRREPVAMGGGRSVFCVGGEQTKKGVLLYCKDVLPWCCVVCERSPRPGVFFFFLVGPICDTFLIKHGCG